MYTTTLVAGENTMSGKKLTDKEKDALNEALKGAVLSDAELERLAEGVDESGETVMPVEDGEDLISAAALALDFVDHLETSAPREITGDEDAVAGFDALLRKLETLRSDISSLQRGVVGVFAAGDAVRGASLVVWAFAHAADVSKMIDDFLK